MNEPCYEVVWPLANSTYEIVSHTYHSPDLSGKTICGSGHSFEGDEAVAAVVELLRRQYPDIKFIPNTSIPEDVSTKEEIAALQNILREKGCDIVLSGTGC